ncbi:DUF2155 domain-containing protein [Roseospira navarrensis]|uniref:DUF2155 domain-containing protein n=1 Tax=Roseospira navarrensis TaxID=140058 RepID=A0A7X2D4M4_9PROT|nr:DUF2155 domain-containing protein [Roseospira navarrensis]MQX36757.1 DUF2155 domain-containing protein [Roseospira navarrensis]
MTVRRLRPAARLSAPAVTVLAAAGLAWSPAAPTPDPGGAALLRVQQDGPSGAAPAPSRDDVPRIDSDHVVLRWLDKSTARVDQVTVPVGRAVTLGGVEVMAQACRRTAPDQTPEHAAFLKIAELQPDEPPRPVFQGWMFASSPSLSAMEHPVYDVWVLECRDTPPGGQDEAGSEGADGPDSLDSPSSASDSAAGSQ